MVGQEQLLAKLDNYTLDTLPKAMLFIGERGAGKHTVINRLATKFNLDIIEINKDTSYSTLVDYKQFPVRRFYLINLNNFIDLQTQQNRFLKFIEEPGSNTYIVLTADSDIGILPTVLNRCAKFYFTPYSTEELKSINWMTASLADDVFKLCTTPGQVLNADSNSVHALYKLCETIINSVSRANFINTLSIATKINYKEEYDKFDFDLFFKALELIAYEKYMNDDDETAFTIYTFTNSFRQNLVNTNLVEETFVLNFLTRLWEMSHTKN